MVRENHRHRGVGDECLGPVGVLFDVDEGGSALGRHIEKLPTLPFRTLEAPAFPLGPAGETNGGRRLTAQSGEETVSARKGLSQRIEAHLDEISAADGRQVSF